MQIYKCDIPYCGKIFEYEEDYKKHIELHKKITKADEMWENGYSLFEINNTLNIWDKLRKNLKSLNKETIFLLDLDFQNIGDKEKCRIEYITGEGKLHIKDIESYWWNEYSVTHRVFSTLQNN